MVIIKSPKIQNTERDVGEFEVSGGQHVPDGYAPVPEEVLFSSLRVDKIVDKLEDYLSGMLRRNMVFGRGHDDIGAKTPKYTVRDFVITSIHRTLRRISNSSTCIVPGNQNYFLAREYDITKPDSSKSLDLLLGAVYSSINQGLQERGLVKMGPLFGTPLYPEWEPEKQRRG